MTSGIVSKEITESQLIKPHWRMILLLTVLTLAPRITLAIFTYGAGLVDIRNYEIVGNAVLEGRTAYDLELRNYPYPPPWMYIEAAALSVARNTGVSFDFVIKFPIIVSDIFITCVIYLFLRQRGSTLENSVLWALTFALNPVAIMVSAGHGQFDSIVILFTLLSVYLMVNHHSEHNLRVFFAALLLDCGIALKLYPVLILPVLLFCRYRQTGSLRQCLAFAVVSAIPLAMALIPFVVVGQWNAFVWPIKYPLLGGVPDFGIVRVLSYLHISIPYLQQISKIAFFIGYVVVLLTISFEREWALAAVVAIFTMFYATVGVIGAQYYFWVIPFAAVVRARALLPYSIVSGLTLLCFYTAIHPAGIVGPHTLPAVLRTAAHQVLPFCVTLLWSFSFAWMTMLMTRRVRARPSFVRRLVQSVVHL